jgi:hypothetical protein
MVEYGNGVSEVAGRSGGGGGGRSMDAGAAIGQAVNDSIHTISTMPPGALVLGFVIIVVGFFLLKRAF